MLPRYHSTSLRLSFHWVVASEVGAESMSRSFAPLGTGFMARFCTVWRSSTQPPQVALAVVRPVTPVVPLSAASAIMSYVPAVGTVAFEAIFVTTVPVPSPLNAAMLSVAFWKIQLVNW